LKLPGIYNRRNGDILHLLFFLLFILAVQPSLIAQINFPIGSRAAALANAVVMDSGIWSVSHNQAGLGDYHYLGLGFHHENKYVTPEYALHALALTVPVKMGTFGISYTYFGYSKYNENKIGLAFGKKLGPKFSAGVQLNYHYVYVIEDYESRHAVTVEGGIQYKPLPSIRIGLHLFNPTRSHLSPTSMDTINTTMRAGISYTPFKKLWMAVESEKSLDTNLRIKSGIEYEVYDGLYLRTGIITQPVQNTFGLGYSIKRINADIAFSHDPVLGFTPHFSFDVRFK
jgi:hypothetical protein